MVYATRADGSVFEPNPMNIGVESELYTRFGADDVKDTSIEDWFAQAIDNPATATIEHLLDPRNCLRRHGWRGKPNDAAVMRELGFRVNDYIDEIKLPSAVRSHIANYVAALLVRHPIYLKKLTQFHETASALPDVARALALENMLHLFQIYAGKLFASSLLLTRRVGTAEYLFSDGGVVVDEPWRSGDTIPFEIHAPLTPDIALQVLPLPSPIDLSIISVCEVTNRGIARQNRIALADAKRFVFSRQRPPTTFIAKYFGLPAPKNIGFRFVDGQLETKYDPARQ